MTATLSREILAHDTEQESAECVGNKGRESKGCNIQWLQFQQTKEPISEKSASKSTDGNKDESQPVYLRGPIGSLSIHDALHCIPP
jgi:hypothetical protein